MTYLSWRNSLNKQLESYFDFFPSIPDNESKNKLLEEMVSLKAKIMAVNEMKLEKASVTIELYFNQFESILNLDS